MNGTQYTYARLAQALSDGRQTGDRVLVASVRQSTWHVAGEGVIESRDGTRALVRFDSGTRAWHDVTECSRID